MGTLSDEVSGIGAYASVEALAGAVAALSNVPVADKSETAHAEADVPAQTPLRLCWGTGGLEN